MQEYEHVLKENLTRMVDFILVDAPYSVQRKRINTRSAYDVFSSHDMKDMSKVLGDIITPGAHGRAFLSALQLVFWYKSFPLREKEWQESRKKSSGEGGSESEVSDNVASQPGSEKKNPVPHCIHAVGNYKQTMAVKRVAHTYVIEKAIYFWISGPS